MPTYRFLLVDALFLVSFIANIWHAHRHGKSGWFPQLGPGAQMTWASLMSMALLVFVGMGAVLGLFEVMPSNWAADASCLSITAVQILAIVYRCDHLRSTQPNTL